MVKNHFKNLNISRIQIQIQIFTKIESILPCRTPNLSTKFRPNPSTTFWDIVLYISLYRTPPKVDGGDVFTPVCLFVCFWTGYLEKLLTDSDETWWTGWLWNKEELIRFWWRFKSGSGTKNYWSDSSPFSERAEMIYSKISQLVMDWFGRNLVDELRGWAQ